MATVRLDITTAGLDAMQAILDPVRFRKDVSAGLRYAGSGAKTTAAKEIGARYALTSARIKQDISNPVVQTNALLLKFGRRPPTLRGYGGRPLARGGYSYQIFRGQRERRSDIFELPIGPGLPFRRTGKGRSGLTVMYGPSVGSIFVGRSRFGDEVRRVTTERVMVQFVTGVKREQARRARGY